MINKLKNGLTTLGLAALTACGGTTVENHYHYGNDEPTQEKIESRFETCSDGVTAYVNNCIFEGYFPEYFEYDENGEPIITDEGNYIFTAESYYSATDLANECHKAVMAYENGEISEDPLKTFDCAEKICMGTNTGEYQRFTVVEQCQQLDKSFNMTFKND